MRALGTSLGILLRILLGYLLGLIDKIPLGRMLGLFNGTLFFDHTFCMASTETDPSMEFILFLFASVVFALSTSFVIFYCPLLVNNIVNSFCCINGIE